MLISLNSSSLSDPKGFIGDIDEISVFSKVLSAAEITHQYYVGQNSPNEYSSLLQAQGADGIYSFEDIGPIVSGLKKDNDDYVEVKLWMAAACEESTSFALTPANNKIQFVIMDSDASPRDQTAIQNDPELQGDEQLVPTGVPYQGVVTLEWNDDGADFTFTSNGSTHVWDGIDMAPNKLHALRFQFDGRRAIIKLMQLPHEDSGEWIEEIEVFNSGYFPLEFRLRGGAGWRAQLIDHEAFIHSVYIEDVEFGEYRSAPFRSRTPYQGAQIFQSSTPSKEFVEQFAASDWGGSITPDQTRTLSDKAYKINTAGNVQYEGIRTQKFWIQNPRDLVVSLRVISGVNLDIFLYHYQTDTIIPLHSHETLGPDWFDIEKLVSVEHSGEYALYVTSSSFGQWFVDAISVRSSSIEWSARQDQEALWMPLKNLTDSKYGGVVFEYPGKELQVRGVSKTIDGDINDVQIQPKYAELGKFSWRDKVNG